MMDVSRYRPYFWCIIYLVRGVENCPLCEFFFYKAFGENFLSIICSSGASILERLHVYRCIMWEINRDQEVCSLYCSVHYRGVSIKQSSTGVTLHKFPHYNVLSGAICCFYK